MKRNKQKLSMVLALLITSYSIFCPTQIVNAEATADSKVISSESSKLIEDKMKPDNTKILADDELAEVLTERGVINQTHTERLYDKEDDLNTLVYLDNDGSETAYIFNEAVKYVDSNNNIKDKSKVLNFDYKKSIKYFSERNIKFDVIFADPPYDYHVIEKILTLIDKYDILNDNGIVVVEFEKEKLDNSYGKLNLIKDKKYGWRYIYIYKKC